MDQHAAVNTHPVAASSYTLRTVRAAARMRHLVRSETGRRGRRHARDSHTRRGGSRKAGGATACGEDEASIVWSCTTNRATCTIVQPIEG